MQVSNVVKAKAETVNATNPTANCSGMPNVEIIPPIPVENKDTGPSVANRSMYSERPSTITAPTAIIARKDSINIPPNPTTLASLTLSNCLEVVPEATNE